MRTGYTRSDWAENRGPIRSLHQDVRTDFGPEIKTTRYQPRTGPPLAATRNSDPACAGPLRGGRGWIAARNARIGRSVDSNHDAMAGLVGAERRLGAWWDSHGLSGVVKWWSSANPESMGPQEIPSGNAQDLSRCG